MTRTDFLDLSTKLSEEENNARQTAMEFTEREVMPVINKHFDAGTFPGDLMIRMGELGYLGVTVPREYGGAGGNYVTYGLICQEIEAGDSGLRSALSVQGSLVMYPILKFGTEDQRRRWLPGLASGELIGCFGLTEPGFGSNPGGMACNARKVDGGFILNGTKSWISNAQIADVSVVWARADDRKLMGFLVEKGTEGLATVETGGKLSLRTCPTGELILKNCFVPEDSVLPDANGLRAPLACLTQARYGIAWGAVGVAMNLYESSVKYAKERVQFDKPIASFQMVQNKLVRMLTEITTAQLLALEVGRKMDKGEATTWHVSMAKKNNVRVARDCAKIAREIHGANGILSEYPIMRHMMNLETVFTYEGTDDIHTLILGEKITGIPAYR